MHRGASGTAAYEMLLPAHVFQPLGSHSVQSSCTN
jgi:hypothetical protein